MHRTRLLRARQLDREIVTATALQKPTTTLQTKIRFECMNKY